MARVAAQGDTRPMAASREAMEDLRRILHGRAAFYAKADAVRTAVINKRAGGMGLISGRKAFQRPMNEGVEILNAIQDVYLDPSVTVA